MPTSPTPRDIDSTQELVQRYVAGDESAGERLFREHGEFLMRRAARRRAARQLDGRVAIDDLVHETFARVLASQSLRTFEDRGPGSLRKLLATILERVIVDARRRESRHPWAGQQERTAPLLSRSATPTSTARARELIDLARGLLAPREWQIWHRADVEGFTPIEIATVLGTSDAAVRGVLHRARKKMLLSLSATFADDARDERGSDASH